MLRLYGETYHCPLWLGTANYPSPQALADAIRTSGTEMVTVSLRRQQQPGEGTGFWQLIQDMGVAVLPNTAGCRSVSEAMTTAHMAREVFGTKRIKLEITCHEDVLHPDIFALVEAAEQLGKDGFQVFPYTTDDLAVGEKLLAAGCEVLMPWGAMIGSGQGLSDVTALRVYRTHFKDVPLVIDAGIGKPSHAAQAMELGYDGILMNSAVAGANDSVKMAEAMSLAIRAGQLGYQAGPIPERDMAVPSTPVIGTPFWHMAEGN